MRKNPKFERQFLKTTKVVLSVQPFKFSTVSSYNKARILNKTIGVVQSHESSVLQDNCPLLNVEK